VVVTAPVPARIGAQLAVRRIASQRVEDLQADHFVGEQLGGDLDIERRND
jgi:hypothetical protein